MPSERLTTAYRLVAEGIAVLEAAAGSDASADERLSVLTFCEGTSRRLDKVAIDATASLDRDGTFTDRGYRNSTLALADLLNLDRAEARRRTGAADQVVARTSLDGTELPALLPATAARFADGRIGLDHVTVITTVMNSHAARRVEPDRLAQAEQVIAEHACLYNPAELRTWATQLIDALDEDGPDPDDTPPPQLNTLTVVPHRNRCGGTIRGRFDDAAMFDAVATAVDALAAPRSALDDRSSDQRKADALVDICTQVIERGDLPETGGRRPVLNVIVTLDDLQNRARAAVLDFGGQTTPEALRMLACDAGVVPIVMNGQGQPLDVGRMTRTIPDGMRRAITARDRGCAHPGCDRPPSWCEIHHVRPWERDGDTRLDNLVMLCRVHHRLLHHSDWLVRIRDGLPEFLPPRWVDPMQRPRRQPPRSADVDGREWPTELDAAGLPDDLAVALGPSG